MTASDLRAAIARQQILIYLLAAEVQLHPGRLAQMLNERIPLPAAVATRVAEAIDRIAAKMIAESAGGPRRARTGRKPRARGAA